MFKGLKRSRGRKPEGVYLPVELNDSQLPLLQGPAEPCGICFGYSEEMQKGKGGLAPKLARMKRTVGAIT